MVSERRGNVKIWDLAERCLPNSFLNQSNRAQDEVEYFAVQRDSEGAGSRNSKSNQETFSPRFISES